MAKKHKTPLDLFEFSLMPIEQQVYVARTGYHFDRKLYEYAASLMRRMNKQTQREEKVPVYTKVEVDSILRKYGIEVENKGNYDYVYIAQKCRADNFGGSIPDEHRLALYVKEICDDIDAPDGLIYREWVMRMATAGESVDWDQFIQDEE